MAGPNETDGYESILTTPQDTSGEPYDFTKDHSQGTPGIIAYPVLPEQMKQRATKAAIAADGSHTEEQLVNVFSTPGGEESFNWDLALKKNQTTVVKNQADLQALVAESPFGGVTPDIAKAALDKNIIKFPVSKDAPIWEAEYSRKMLETTVQASGIMSKYGPELAGNEQATGMMNAYQKVSTLREAFKKLAENEDAEARSSSWTTTIKDTAIAIIPNISWLSSTRPELYKQTSSILPGNSLDEQITNLYKLGQRDPELAITAAKQAIAAIKQVSPVNAREFAGLLNSFTDSDANVANLVGVADALSIPSTLKAAGRGLSILAGTLGSAVKATGRGVLSGVHLLDASGAVEKASLLDAWTKVRTKTVQAGIPVKSIDEIATSVLTMSNPTAAVNGGQFLGRAGSQRLEDAMIDRAGSLLNLGSRAQDVGALDTPGVVQAALLDAADTARRLHPGMSHSVVDVRLISAQETVSGIDTASILVGKPKGTVLANGTVVSKPISEPSIAITIARKDATPFDSELSARKAASDIYKIKDYEVIQHGSKFVLEVRRPLDMTSSAAKQALEIETGNSTPKSFFNTYFSALRNRDFVNSPQLVRDLKVATYGGSGMAAEFGRLVNKAFGGVKSWRKEDINDFQRFLEAQRDVVSKGVRGKFSRNTVEFEKDWMAIHGKLPSEKQAQAYFAYQQFNDSDYVWRNIQEHATRARQGRELFSFDLDGYKMKRGMVEGKFIKTGIPWDLPENANILVWNKDSRAMAHANAVPLNTRFASAQMRAAYDDMVRNQGYKVIQISEDGERMLRSIPGHNAAIGDHRLQYILTNDTTNSPLGLKIFPYRPGGHVKYDPEGYVLRQPILSQPMTHAGVATTYYSGDRSLFHFRDKKEALVYQKHMDEVRKILNDLPALEAYRAANLGHVFNSTQDIRKIFSANGAKFDPGHAFQVTKMDQSVDQATSILKYARTNNETVINTRDSLHNLDRGRANTTFTSERDLDMTGIYHGFVETGRKIDPMSTMVQANTSLMRGRYMEDFKVRAAERYVAEFYHLFDGVDSLDQVKQSPLTWLMSDKFKPNANKAEVAAARNAQFSVRSLMGQKTQFQEYVDTANANISEAYFHALGDKGKINEKVYKAITNVLDFPLISNPVNFVRSVAFYPKMGFFNPAQMFIQAQTLGVISAVAGPAVAAQAMRGYASMKMASLTNKENVIEHLANIAGWKPQHFKEALEGIRATGFGNVGREFSDVGDMTKVGSVKTATGTFLDAGLGFFKEGEKLSRFGAWNSAYLEWRKANPVAKFDAKAQADVLNRADNLNVNMSSASDSRISKSTLGSMLLQFTSYQAKLTENVLMGMATGKGAFNRGEAVKVAMMQTALYGVPVGLLGTVAGVAPWYQNVKEYLFNKGIDTDDDQITKAMNDGLMGYMTELATGSKLNVAERYGSGGLSLFKDLLTGDPRQFEKAILGAGLDNMHQFWKNAQPLMTGLSNAVHGNYIMGLEDINEALKPITTVNAGIKIYYAMNLGKLVSRNEGHFGDFTTTEAVTNLITGLMPQNVSDTYLKLEWERDRKAGLKFAEERATVNFRRAAEALAKGDYDLNEKYNIRAQVYLDATDMTVMERATIARRAANNMTDLADKVDEKAASRTPEAHKKWLERMDRRIRPGALIDVEGNQ